MSVHISVPMFLSVCLLPCFLHWATDNFQSLNAGFEGSVNFHLNAYFFARKSINNFNSYTVLLLSMRSFQHSQPQGRPSTDHFQHFSIYEPNDSRKRILLGLILNYSTDQITKSYFMKGNNCQAMPPINRHWKITEYEARCPDKQITKSADEKG